MNQYMVFVFGFGHAAYLKIPHANIFDNFNTLNVNIQLFG